MYNFEFVNPKNMNLFPIIYLKIFRKPFIWPCWYKSSPCYYVTDRYGWWLFGFLRWLVRGWVIHMYCLQALFSNFCSVDAGITATFYQTKKTVRSMLWKLRIPKSIGSKKKKNRQVFFISKLCRIIILYDYIYIILRDNCWYCMSVFIIKYLHLQRLFHFCS